MTLLFVDGFDHYATADCVRKYNVVFAQSTVPTIVASGRYGGSFARFAGGGQSAWFLKAIPATASVVIGMAVRLSAIYASYSVLMDLRDTYNLQCDLRINPDATLSVTRGGTALTSGTSSLGLSTATWYFIEWKVTISSSISANSCKVRVNGIDWINVATGQSTKSTANSTFNDILFGRVYPSNGTVNCDIDDLYICDQNGSVNNDFLGDVRVEMILPSGAGTTSGWTPSAGSNYAAVDDTAPNDDTDYVSTQTATTKDTYAFGNLSNTPDSINGVQITTLLRKTDAGNKTFTPVIRSGGTDYDQSTVAVYDNYAFDTQVKETDPATAVAWIGSGVDSAEFGIKCVS